MRFQDRIASPRPRKVPPEPPQTARASHEPGATTGAPTVAIGRAPEGGCDSLRLNGYPQCAIIANATLSRFNEAGATTPRKYAEDVFNPRAETVQTKPSFAAVWEHWDQDGEYLESFINVTTAGAPQLSDIHDRQPAIIDPGPPPASTRRALSAPDEQTTIQTSLAFGSEQELF